MFARVSLESPAPLIVTADAGCIRLHSGNDIHLILDAAEAVELVRAVTAALDRLDARPANHLAQ